MATRPSADNLNCRICHCGVSGEQLISPCRCKGTLALVHRTCVETWLCQSNLSQCEICQAPYRVQRTRRTFAEWLRHPANAADRRNLIADGVCFALLCPLSVASAWLCVAGAQHYLTSAKGEYEALGLIAVTAFLLLVFLGWLYVSVRYHLAVWRDWRESHFRIRLVDDGECLVARTRSVPTMASEPGHSLFRETPV